MISFESGVEFQHLCEHYLGRRAEFVQDFMVATAPDHKGRYCIYRVPDDSALATYIRLAHPEWIDYAWTAKNPAATIIDGDETYIQLQRRGLQ